MGYADHVELGLDGPAAARMEGGQAREGGQVLVRVAWRAALVGCMSFGDLPLATEIEFGVERRLLETGARPNTDGDPRDFGPAIIRRDEMKDEL